MSVKVRATAITHTANGRPLAPGDEVSLPDREAERLVNSGKAVGLSVRKTTTKKEKADATSGK